MTDNRPVTIYVSASPNLMAEREALARMIAELPVTLVWHIVQTPLEAKPIDIKAVQSADLFFLIMGPIFVPRLDWSYTLPNWPGERSSRF